MVTKSEAAELLELIAERAPKLRAAGIRGRVSLGDVSFELDAAAADTTGDQTAEEDEIDDPLKDPATFGYRPGSATSGTRRS